MCVYHFNLPQDAVKIFGEENKWKSTTTAKQCWHNKPDMFLYCCEHNLTCEEKEHENHDHGVSKVEDSAGHSDYLQLWEEVMHRINEQVDCCESAGQEGTPPPVVILGNTEILR